MWGSWKTLKRVYWISLKYLRFFFPWFSWNWLVGIVGQCQYEGPSDMDYTTWRVQRTGKCFKVSHRWSKGLWKHRGLFGKKSEKKKDILSSEKPKIPSFFSTSFNCLSAPYSASGPLRLCIAAAPVNSWLFGVENSWAHKHLNSSQACMSVFVDCKCVKSY